MLLFADTRAGVVGACHAGWKGALTGVIEATVAAMEGEGARYADIHIALGPMIGPQSYEVSAEFVERFVAEDAAHERFFTPSPRAGHAMFDLPAFIGARVARLGVASFENLGVDTYADEARCFSFRRCTHRGEEDYGRLVSAIMLA
jgi:YfiH family protein